MRTNRQGFTLIELLAGITVLIILVLFLTRVFTDSTNMWQLGTKRVESNLSGRTAVEFMSRELAGAIFDGNLTLKLVSDATNALGYASDELYFITTDQKTQISSSGNLYRQSKAVRYRLDHMDHPDHRINAYLPHRYRIERSGLERYNNSVLEGLYTNSNWWSDFQPTLASSSEKLIDNVRAIDFWVYDQSGNNRANYDSSVDGPPAWIDIVVEVLPESDSVRIAQMQNDDERLAYADRVARRYFNRVYFHNFNPDS